MAANSVFSFRVYKSVATRGQVIVGGPDNNTTPAYKAFSPSGLIFHEKTNFENLFTKSFQPASVFWNATNSVVEDTISNVLYSSPSTVAQLVAAANA